MARRAAAAPDPSRPGEDRGARPRVLILSPHNSYRVAPFLEAARRLGVQAVLASSSAHSLISAVADGIQVDFTRLDEAEARIAAALGGAPPQGITGTDDATVELAARLARRYGRAHNPPEAARISRRKDLARARLARAGVPVPAHRLLDLRRPAAQQLAGLGYPLVVKPLALSGSRGVIRADDPRSLAVACGRIDAILAREPAPDELERHHVLAETFVPGREYALEGLLGGGRLRPLALFEKPDPLEGPYFEETYYVMPARISEAERAILWTTVERACRAYGLVTGPVHAELRLHAGRAWVMEVASRSIGGQCARLLRFGTGRSLEELLVAEVVGRPLPTAPPAGAAGVLMIPIPRRGVLRRVEGLLAAARVPGIEDIEISIREGYELVPLPEGASYLGFMFARAQRPAEVEAALREAHARLRIVTAPVWHLETG